MRPTREELRPWLRSATGGKILVLEPFATKIELEHIARTLARICRFGGMLASCSFYSVASHSVCVSHLVRDELAAAALLHDATEAFMGCDMPGPLKLQFPTFRALEHQWQLAIEQRFGFEPAAFSVPEIKRADRIAQETERRDLLVAPYVDAKGWDPRGTTEKPADFAITPDQSVELAAEKFYRRAVELGLS